MLRLQSRLGKIEKAMNPPNRISIVFLRNGYKEEDYAKQKSEYFSRWGDKHEVTFLQITEYCDIDEDYDTFIHKMRATCPPGNCYTDWWDRKEYPCT